jgi:SAM-dependent methyltransferase
VRAHPDEAVEAFNDDARHGGYVYTTSDALSSRLAIDRMTRAIDEIADLRGKRIVDIACGDGAFTNLLRDPGGAVHVRGIDFAAEAVAVARQQPANTSIEFDVGDASRLPYEDDQFDVAQLRAVIHHFERPREAIREALRVAPTMVVLEPNGNNPGLKLFERFHPYHRKHGERSYSPRTFDRWVREAGGRVVRRTFVGLVPVFFPERLTKIVKACEPAVEKTPLLRSVVCAQYVFVATRARAR